MADKIIRLLAKTVLICIIFLGQGSVLAAVGELEVPLLMDSRIVPPLDIKKFPGGLSIIPSESYIFKYKKAGRTWDVTIPESGEYLYRVYYIGDIPMYMPIPFRKDQYIGYISAKKAHKAWLKAQIASGVKSRKDRNQGVDISIPIDLPDQVKSIIGEGGPRITVTGNRRISFSGRSEWDDLTNTGTFKQSKFPSLHMEQTSRFKIRGEIGSKVHIEVDQDSNRDVDLANTLKLRYKGDDDEIIQSIEAGNTNLSLPNSQLIGYSQNVQGLFGIKATARIGAVDFTMITSQEKGASEKSSFSAGAQPDTLVLWDYQYLPNTYFYLSNQFTANDSLVEVKLFVQGDERDIYGTACVDPIGLNPGDPIDSIAFVDSLEDDRGEYVRGYFKLLDETEYEIFNGGKYVILRNQLDRNTGILAAYYIYKDMATSQFFQEGRIDGDTLALKLIRDPDVDTSFVTWDLEWKNVYSLGLNDLTSEGFELQIFKGSGNSSTDTLDQDGTPYIELFGFDEVNNTNLDSIPDGVFDFDVQHDLDLSRGHLIFNPVSLPLPFDASFLNVPNSLIYTELTNKNLYKMYYIWVKTARRSNTFSLGRTNIIEGSEVVKLGDGRILKRGVDYNIIYEIGQITFISEDAVNLASNISVDYEYSPFFLPEKKSLFGVAARYAINDKSSISFAGMYRSESAQEYRPRVGREPRRSMIWDSNFIFHLNPAFLTTAVDALPLIETDAPSVVELSGEIAQSMPNPNTRNEAYIDDFEGTKEFTDLVMRRGVWTTASPPRSWSDREWTHRNRRSMWWYNPYSPYLISEIWPEREDYRENENRHDVLILEYFPDSTAGQTDTLGWAGIMRPLYAGLSDQTRTKFIELWYYPDDTLSAGDGYLVIDAGKISEDIDDDNIWDTEDINYNGVFEENEDSGLDNWDDNEERINLNSSEDDPSGDNWYYSGDPDDRHNYSQINGTQGNRVDPDRLNRFDTEDINNNKAHDKTNSYYQYRISLKNPEFLEETTSSGWRLLRIPLQDPGVYEVFGNPNFSSINYIRLWIAGTADYHKLRFASLELVGNKWREMALPEPYYINGVPTDTRFEVTVKNSQEHAHSYYSPPGVAGVYNKDSGIREKEQSLVLNYNDLFPGQSVSAYWSLLSTENYTFYNKLKMFVHGDDEMSDDIPLYFFFRLGADSISTYYEYKVRLSPGWADDNSVEIDFEKITGIKAIFHNNLLDNGENPALFDTTVYDSTGRTEYPAIYTIKGNPSLSQIRFFAAGIEYPDTLDSGDSSPLIPASGEVWCDELLLTDVRRKSDYAGRLSSKIKLADFGDITINYSRTGADFFPLNAKKPSGSQATSQAITGRFKIDKFVPPSWGLTLPVTLSWQKNKQLPRLKTGSDIILPEALKDAEKTENRQWSVNASERFSRRTNNWLWNLTLNRIDSRATYTKKYGTSPTTPISNNTTYEIAGKYDLPQKISPSTNPFIWMKYLLMPNSIRQMNLFLLPSIVKYDSRLNSTRTFTQNRNTRSSTYIRDLSLNQQYQMSLFTGFKIDYSTSSIRDISDPQLLKFSADPRKLELGRERNFNQNFSASITPTLHKLLKPRIQYSAKYKENSDLARNPDSTRSTQLNANLRGDLSLDLNQLFKLDQFLRKKPGQSKPKPSKPEPSKPALQSGYDGEEDVSEIGEDEEQKAETPESAEKDGFAFPNPLKAYKGIFYILRSIKPFQNSFAIDKQLSRSGLYDRPGWLYTLGIVDKVGVRRNLEGTGFDVNDQIARTRDYSVRTGITPVSKLDISTSFKYRLSVNRGSNVPTETKSVDFPSVDMTLSGVDKFPIFNKLTQTANLQFGFTRKTDESGNPDTGALNERSVNDSYSPLLGLNLNLKNGIRSTIRYEQSQRRRENLRDQGSNQRIDHSQDRTFRVTIDYSITAPNGLRIPLFGKLKFNSQLTLSLELSKKYRRSWFNLEGVENTDIDTDEISIEPRASYKFSAKITGGLNARWSDINDKIQDRKRHIRELGIWTELRF